ncbi:hypothetical protein CaCOL14_012789 [Colletotrichum acutatum]
MAVCLPAVLADWWDDFSNNLASDLAPLLSLFGEQITKQYLSESTTVVDYFIFAMAPMGILTAIVSAIRSQWYKRTDERRSSVVPHDKSPDTSFAPNLSLNIGIKKRPALIFWVSGLVGLILQVGVLVFAVVVTYYLGWEKNGNRPESYACPLLVIGTILLCSGMFLCAFIIGQSTEEEVWCKKDDGQSSFFWIQPGGQIVGDQNFDAFCYGDGDDPKGSLKEYMTSWKRSSSYKSGVLVWAAISITIPGFVLQFTGLRGTHPTVSVIQLGVTMLMSAARAGLRMQRLDPEANLFANCPDQVVGHELDWLALWIGRTDINYDLGGPASGESPVQSSQSPQSYYFWKLCAIPDNDRRITCGSPGSDSINVGSKVLAHRTRLAELTETLGNLPKSSAPARNFEINMVEVRQEAQRLSTAIESAVNAIFSRDSRVRKEWGKTSSIWYRIGCAVSSLPKNRQTSETNEFREGESQERRNIYLELISNNKKLWQLRNKFEIEGILGLWLWSLKSDPTSSVEVSLERIISTNQSIVANVLLGWLGKESVEVSKKGLSLEHTHFGDSNVIWSYNQGNWQPWLHGQHKSQSSRLFGWYWIRPENISSFKATGKFFEVCSVPTSSSLLSLCSQEILGLFISSTLEILDEVGIVDSEEDSESLLVEIGLVSELVEIFIRSGLGSREDAILCVLPAIMGHLDQNPLISAAQHGNMDEVDRQLEIEDEPGAEDKDTDGRTALWWAARNRRESVVKCLLGNDYADPNIADSNGRTALWWAARNGDARVVKLLLNDDRICHEVQNHNNESPLKQAAKRGHDAVVELFLNEYDDESGRTGLSRASEKGDYEVVKLLLDSNQVRPEARNENGRTSLSWAAQNGHEAVVELLLDTDGVDPNTKDKDGRTPLSWAAQNGHEAVVKLLLDTDGVDPNTKDKDGRTPLSWAAKNGHEVVVELLLDTDGVDPNTKDKDGRTQLSWAAQNGHEVVVKLLLDTDGVDPSINDKDGRTPLSWAAQNGHEAVVELLLDTDGVDPSINDKDGRTPLFWAAKNGHEVVVELLLDTDGVDPNTKDKDGRTPLSWAAQNGHEVVVKLLLDTDGVDPSINDKDGRTPLSWAAQNGHEAVVELLLDTDGVDPSINDKDGRTPLFWAAKNGHEVVVELLLDTDGVDPNTKDKDGRTQLSWAAQNGHEVVVKLLLDTDGVDPSINDKDGRTPLFWAAKNGHEVVVELLLDTDGVDPNTKDKDGRTPLSWAAQNGHEAVVKLLLDTDGVDPNTKDKDGRTPLFWAAKNGHEVVVELLLDTDGVDPNTKDKDGRTQLSWAAQNGHEAVVKLLLDTDGVDPSINDKDGWTPLFWAVSAAWTRLSKPSNQPGNLALQDYQMQLDLLEQQNKKRLRMAGQDLAVPEAVVKLLLKSHKVKPDAKDNYGRTALSWAAQSGREEIVKLLLNTNQVDPDIKDNNGWTPLRWAAEFKRDTFIKPLLDTNNQAGPNNKDKDGWTSLCYDPSCMDNS